jgi:hypothetical protein
MDNSFFDSAVIALQEIQNYSQSVNDEQKIIFIQSIIDYIDNGKKQKDLNQLLKMMGKNKNKDLKTMFSSFTQSHAQTMRQSLKIYK